MKYQYGHSPTPEDMENKAHDNSLRSFDKGNYIIDIFDVEE
jgi:hypothetical protein